MNMPFSAKFLITNLLPIYLSQQQNINRTCYDCSNIYGQIDTQNCWFPVSSSNSNSALHTNADQYNTSPESKCYEKLTTKNGLPYKIERGIDATAISVQTDGIFCITEDYTSQFGNFYKSATDRFDVEVTCSNYCASDNCNKDLKLEGKFKSCGKLPVWYEENNGNLILNDFSDIYCDFLSGDWKCQEDDDQGRQIYF